MNQATKLKIIIGAILVVLILLISVGVLISGSSKKSSSSQEASPTPLAKAPNSLEEFNRLKRFKQAKYKFLSFTNSQGESESTEVVLGRAKISYLTSPNIFEGSVENASTINEYRQAKSEVIEQLRSEGIGVCDLDIYWVRPLKIPLEEFSVDDIKTDGC